MGALRGMLRRLGEVVTLSPPRRQRDLLTEWERRGFTAPSPHSVKQAVVLRNGLHGGTWIETGTYLGDTTERLADVALKVYSIEPEPTLCSNARHRLQHLHNVEILNGTSEDLLPSLVPTLQGEVSFWLDGHYSGNGTYKGPHDTPIAFELAVVAANLHRMTRVVVMVDDVRLFTGEVHSYGPYATIDELVNWARESRLRWHIEQDIFIARTL